MTNPTQILFKPSSVEQTTPCASILQDHKNFMLIFLILAGSMQKHPSSSQPWHRSWAFVFNPRLLDGNELGEGYWHPSGPLKILHFLKFTPQKGIRGCHQSQHLLSAPALAWCGGQRSVLTLPETESSHPAAETNPGSRLCNLHSF